ncbi:hypothetical protein HN51_062923 [Arachis hypogaea]|nr:uncharacterized protein DS421_11g336740 [Arachis hypogaea]
MGIGGRVGDYAFKAFTATLGATTLYLTATFSVNLYRGFVWHNSQTKFDKQDAKEQAS